MLDWYGLLLVLGFVSLILGIYMLITRSAGIYASPRHFWTTTLVSAGLAYLLSGGLFLLFHLTITVAVALSAIVPFLVGNLNLGDTTKEPAPSDEGLEPEALPAGDEEDDALGDDGDGFVDEEGDEASSADEVAVTILDETEPRQE